MKWSYEDPKNIPKDRTRLVIGDTDEFYPMLFDEEIEVFLEDRDGKVNDAAYDCVTAILNKLAYEPNYTIGPESIKGSSRLKTLQMIADKLDPARNDGAPQATPPGTGIFSVGMQDNQYDSGKTWEFNYGPF